MSTMPVRKGLAITSLALGLVGLVTAGGCGLGAIAGLAAGAIALVRARRDPAVHGGVDVAWAGIVSNTLALLTIGPVVALLVTLNRAGSLPRLDDADELPEPVGVPLADEYVPPPPPPPPAPRPAASEAPSPTEPLRLGDGISEPRKLRHVPPAYPDEAIQARVQGVVVLEATIDPSGKVADVRVLRSIPLLDAAAVAAVRQWEYTPTRLNGVPVPVIVTVTVTFRLS